MSSDGVDRPVRMRGTGVLHRLREVGDARVSSEIEAGGENVGTTMSSPSKSTPLVLSKLEPSLR